VALTAVIIIGQILAKLFAYPRQPPVIEEVVAGIVLRPSLPGPEMSAKISRAWPLSPFGSGAFEPPKLRTAHDPKRQGFTVVG
jgi:hypothetical protein